MSCVISIPPWSKTQYKLYMYKKINNIYICAHIIKKWHSICIQPIQEWRVIMDVRRYPRLSRRGFHALRHPRDFEGSCRCRWITESGLRPDEGVFHSSRSGCRIFSDNWTERKTDLICSSPPSPVFVGSTISRVSGLFSSTPAWTRFSSIRFSRH